MRQILVLIVLLTISCSAFALPVIRESDFAVDYVYFSGRGVNSKPADKRIDIWGTEQLLSKTWKPADNLLVIGRLGNGIQTLTSPSLNFDPAFERRGMMLAFGGGVQYQPASDRFFEAQALFLPMNPGLEYEYIVPHATYGLYGYNWLELQLSAGLKRGPFYYGIRYSYLGLMSPSVEKKADAGYESLIYDLPSSFDPASTFGVFVGVNYALSEKCNLMAELECLDQLSVSLGMGVVF